MKINTAGLEEGRGSHDSINSGKRRKTDSSLESPERHRPTNTLIWGLQHPEL